MEICVWVKKRIYKDKYLLILNKFNMHLETKEICFVVICFGQNSQKGEKSNLSVSQGNPHKDINLEINEILI